MASIGIDLGLDSSCVAVCLNGQVKVIPSDIGNRTTPSCVAFIDTHCFVGDAAFDQAASNLSNTIFGSRMLIGRKFNDEVVQRYIHQYTLNVVPSLGSNNDKKPMIVVSYKGRKRKFEAVDIFAMILKKLKEDAEAYLGKEVKNVVITVPASFNYLQLQATKDAGLIAGLNIIHVIDEPTAAAKACGLGKKAADGRKNVLVFGLGRETCEVSLVEIEKDAYKVKSTRENNTLGASWGQNFDNRLANFLVCEFKKKHGTTIRGYRDLNRLRAACERAKVSRSLYYEVTVEINFLGIDYQFTLTRALFKKLNYELLRHCVSFVNKCLDDAKMTKEDVDEVVFVGGESSIPIVQQELKEFFGEAMSSNIHPEEVVAHGAALHAATIACTLPRQTTNIPLLLEDVDSLLNGFGDSKPVKPVTSFTKHKIAEILNRVKLDCSNIQLMESLFLLVRKIDISLPEHLRPALKGLEQTLAACQQRFLEKAAETEACFIDPQEVTLINADLTTSKKKIESSSSYCNKLKEDIADIDAWIARVMDQRASLKSDLDFAQLNLAGLTDSLNTQMESAKKRLDRFLSFQAAEKLESESKHSLGVALDCLGNLLASL